MRPDASRSEIVACLRRLADLIHANLPRRVLAGSVFLPWEVTAPLLLARIARQGETLALLVENEHELDGEMVMRSLLEHLILFAWLAIEPDDDSREWLAKSPAANTEWWMIDQFRREKRGSEELGQVMPGYLDKPMRAAIRRVTKYVKNLPPRGDFPNVLQRAEEVDLHWAHRLDGWQTAGPGDPHFATTFRGHYWTLYARGSTSVHPDWGAIRRFLTPPSSTGYQRHHLGREAPDAQVNVFLSITAYLLGDAVAVADASLGWTAYDEALRILDRWDDVRAPGLLLSGAQLVLDGRRRAYARAGERLLRVDLTTDRFAVTVVEPGGGWWRLRHPLVGREWHRDEEGAEGPNLNARTGFDLGPVVMRCVELLAEARWLGRKPRDWPADVE